MTMKQTMQSIGVALSMAALPACQSVGDIAPSMKDPAKRATPYNAFMQSATVSLTEGSICVDGCRKTITTYESTNVELHQGAIKDDVVTLGAAYLGRPNVEVSQSQGQGQHQGQHQGQIQGQIQGQNQINNNGGSGTGSGVGQPGRGGR